MRKGKPVADVNTTNELSSALVSNLSRLVKPKGNIRPKGNKISRMKLQKERLFHLQQSTYGNLAKNRAGMKKNHEYFNNYVYSL